MTKFALPFACAICLDRFLFKNSALAFRGFFSGTFSSSFSAFLGPEWLVLLVLLSLILLLTLELEAEFALALLSIFPLLIEELEAEFALFLFIIADLYWKFRGITRSPSESTSSWFLFQTAFSSPVLIHIGPPVLILIDAYSLLTKKYRMSADFLKIN